MDIEVLNAKAKEASQPIRRIRDEVARVIVGQQEVVDRLLAAILCGGHCLIEGVPGLAKTTAAKCLASALDVSFRRIQFTPDLLPADLTGTLIYDNANSSFVPHKGPIFANIILADEINRAPAKVQSALLEAMQEKQVTIGDASYTLEEPFLVLATQNPIEQEGTYPLPEAQVDRFMFKVLVSYPSREEELLIMDRVAGDEIPDLSPVASKEDIFRLRELLHSVYVDERVKGYILDVVRATRNPGEYGLADLEGLVEYGASPRAAIWLNLAARARALLSGRAYVTPQDVKDFAPDVLRHRLVLSFEAEARNLSPDDITAKILSNVEVP